MPEGESLAEGAGGRVGAAPLGPRGSLVDGLLPWLLMSAAVLVVLAVLLAKVLWPKVVVEAAIPTAPAELKKQAARPKKAK